VSIGRIPSIDVDRIIVVAVVVFDDLLDVENIDCMFALNATFR
jgi:hypothetical protein